MAGPLVVVQTPWTQLPLVVDWNSMLAATRRPAIPAVPPTTISSASRRTMRDRPFRPPGWMKEEEQLPLLLQAAV